MILKEGGFLALAALLLAVWAVGATQAAISITSCGEFNLIGHDPGYPLDGDYVLMRDLDCGGGANWVDSTRAAPFTGTFDGQGYIVSHLNVAVDRERVGMFGVTREATLQNIMVADSFFSGVEGHVGALVGEFFGGAGGALMRNAHALRNTNAVRGEGVGGLIGYAEGSVTIEDCTAKENELTAELDPGTGMGGNEVGGLVGIHLNGALITRSYAKNNTLNGHERLGGLVGITSFGDIAESCAVGNILNPSDSWSAAGGLVAVNNNYSQIANCYASGNTINGDRILGGLVGNNVNGATVTDCYSSANAMGGTSEIGGLIGRQQGSDSYVTNAYSDETNLPASAFGSGGTIATSCSQDADCGGDGFNIFALTPSALGWDTAVWNDDFNLIHVLCDITDDEGPVTSNVLANPNPVAAATSLSITANVDDTTTGGSTIASASYTLDGGGATGMAATDGGFDETVEDVTATLAGMLLAGVYDVCVSGTDVVGNTGTEECTFLVVYDPDAGFFTGGGWIDSPAGAYLADPSLAGKANFGFVAKYKKGQSVPDGNAEFQFKAGDMNFKSTDYEWLVVAGAKGMFKGWGTINGIGNYGFLVSAIDAALTPSTDVDLFRIKIWDKDNGDALVYDNNISAADGEDPSTELGGGSIIIHKK